MATVDDVEGGSTATRLVVTAAHGPSPRGHRGPRRPLMVLAALSLLSAIVGGLVRLGWALPTTAASVAFHGPLMVVGFLGTVIGLERAVARGRLWAYVAPAATGLGAVLLAAGAAPAAWLMLLGAVALTLVYVEIVRAEAAMFTAVMALGAVSLLVGQALWAVAGWPIHRVVYWWMGFLVLTIVGERLELSRLLRLGAGSRAMFVGAIAVFVTGIALTSAAPEAGVRLAGAAMVAMAVWLGIFDIARRTVGGSGVTRFIAVALLSGYVWLGVTGLFAVGFGDVAAGPRYDAILHALFVGFVFSMILGHAPIMLPAVLGARVAYGRSFYLPLGLLHASLVLRLLGDCVPWPEGRRWGGLLNAVAILCFFATMAHGMLSSRSGADFAAAQPAERP
jgi:hypothetical protein